jgi:hypothetical protein
LEPASGIRGKNIAKNLDYSFPYLFLYPLSAKNEKRATDKQPGKLVLARPLGVAVGSIVGLYSVQSGHVVYSMPALYLVNS